jgi:hypothetical protein
VHKLETEVDENGNSTEIKTDFQILDWKHSCRSCRDLNSLVTTKQTPKSEKRIRSGTKYEPYVINKIAKKPVPSVKYDFMASEPELRKFGKE